MKNRPKKKKTGDPWIIYVVSPYFARDHDTISQNIQLAISEGQELLKHGFLPLVVHNHTHHFEQKTSCKESFYRAFDLRLLELPCVRAIKCSPRWWESQGGRIEVYYELQLDKPVFEDIDDVKAWREGRPHARVSEINLDYRDRTAYAEPTPNIDVVFTIGPYVPLGESVGTRKHMDCVLRSEEASIALWNAGFPAFSPQRALCDMDVSSEQYASFSRQMLSSGLPAACVALPGWRNNRESVEQVKIAERCGIPILGNVDSAIALLSEKEKGGFYCVSAQ